MITGYNHNVIHRNIVYHIQTEDSGIKYPHIITHLFIGGNIISSKKRSYAHLLEKNLSPEELEKAVREMMKEQHKEMLLELKAGKYDHLRPPGESEEEGLSPSETAPAESSAPPQREEPTHLPPPQPIQEPQPSSQLPTTPIPQSEPRGDTSTSSTRKARSVRRVPRRTLTRSRPQFKAPTPAEIDVIRAIKSSSTPGEGEGEIESPTIPELPQLLALFEKGHFESNTSTPSEAQLQSRARFSQIRKERFRRQHSGSKRPVLELKPKGKK